MSEIITLPGGGSIPIDEIQIETSRSSGPGGQNVNKVESRTTARFDVEGSPSLNEAQRSAIRSALASRMTQKGELLVSSQKHRTQGANRRAAIERLEELLQSALTPQEPRRPTKPSRAAKQRRIDEKRRQGKKKRERAEHDWT